MSAPSPTPELQIPLGDFVRFIRQLSHDLRNHLNAAELQSAYLGEISTDPEIKAEIKRLRTMVSETGAALQKLSGTLGTVKLTTIPYGAADFVEDLRQKLGMVMPEYAADIAWTTELPTDTQLEVDPQLLQAALAEIFANAFRHSRGVGPIAASAAIDGAQFCLTIREPKTTFEASTTAWGSEPLRTIKQGHYGLGLHRARTIFEAHEGEFGAAFDPTSAALVTTIRLPVSPPGA